MTGAVPSGALAKISARRPEAPTRRGEAPAGGGRGAFHAGQEVQRALADALPRMPRMRLSERTTPIRLGALGSNAAGPRDAPLPFAGMAVHARAPLIENVNVDIFRSL